ncbi:MAG: AI-2E family transporter [Fimbriimonadaceae bacterium]
MFNTRIIFWVIAFASVIGAVILITPFLPAILWATVFSILMYPTYLKLRKKNWPANVAALTVTLAPLLLVITPLAVFGTFGGIQVYEYVNSWVAESKANGEQDFLVTAATQLDTMIDPILSQMGVKNFDLVQIINDNKDQFAKNITGPLTKGLSSFVVMIVTLVISVLTTFFMVRDSHHLLDPVSDIIPLPKDQTRDILNRMARTVRSVFFAVFIVAILQGFLCGMAFLVAGVEAWKLRADARRHRCRDDPSLRSSYGVCASWFVDSQPQASGRGFDPRIRILCGLPT